MRSRFASHGYAFRIVQSLIPRVRAARISTVHADAVSPSALPASRYVRLILGEYGIGARLMEERFWERREEFLLLNPAGEIPVLVADGQPPIPGAAIIAEYIEETHAAAKARTGCCRLSPGSASKCGGWRTGSTTNFTPRSAALW